MCCSEASKAGYFSEVPWSNLRDMTLEILLRIKTIFLRLIPVKMDGGLANRSGIFVFSTYVILSEFTHHQFKRV